MRRTIIACVVLAAAIATPGIVVAVVHSSGRSQGITVQSVSNELQASGVSGAPIDPRLRPAVSAVQRALAAKGIQLTVLRTGAHSAEMIDFKSHGPCPVDVVFGRRETSFTGCPSGTIDTTIGPIRFSPASLGPTIRQALPG